MRFVSTRGGDGADSIDEALVAGIAADGGLYLPETWPAFAPAELAALRDRPYAEIAVRVLKPLVGGAIVIGRPEPAAAGGKNRCTGGG